MARILYGVMGNTHGHIMRTLALVQRMPEHEFHFVGGGRVTQALAGRWPLLEVPVLRTRHKNQRLDIPGTIWQILQCEFRIPRVFCRLHQLVKKWQPDLAIADREFYLPIFSRLTGLPCLSIDHTHILKACHFEIPPELKRIWRLTLFNDRLLFDFTRRNLIVSFFSAPVKSGVRDEIFPPVLRPEVRAFTPATGDDIFLYLSIPHFEKLMARLRQLPRRVIIYGLRNGHAQDGNLIFKPYDQTEILRDLAACAYAIVNGGHNLICEALYYGKPVLCFPIGGLVEQYLNVAHIRSLQFGDYTYDTDPSLRLFADFEKHLETYRSRIQAGFRDGTAEVVTRLQEIIREYQNGARP